MFIVTEYAALRVYIKKLNFLISQPKHVVGTQKNRLNESSFEHPKHMLKLMGKKIFTLLRLNICIPLNAVMHQDLHYQ